MSIFDNFTKKHDFLVCVDSDGCAMDTMDIKHFKCFGPEMVAEWQLEENAEKILADWNDYNLYTPTRGVNRFKGLLAALTKINDETTQIEDLDVLQEWVETSPALSNAALEQALAEKDEKILRKALAWSNAVNASIKQLPAEDNKPYDGAVAGLAAAHERADVAIVSSANAEAVLEEWTREGLIGSTDILCSQSAGTKAACIAALLDKGYDADHVLMVGDAPGDLDAAQVNGVLYYPILVKHEAESWKDFKDSVLDAFLTGNYAGAAEDSAIARFRSNLGC